MTDFVSKWNAAQESNHSRLAIGIRPRLTAMPAPIARYDDPFQPFCRAIITATADLACAYVFDLGAFLALGAAGARALERSIPLVPKHIPAILHGPFVTPDYAQAAFEEALAADAVTLATTQPDIIAAYADRPEHGVFCPSSEGQAAYIGTWNAQGFTLNGVCVRWVTEPIIYASGRNDFEAVARAVADSYRQESLK